MDIGNPTHPRRSGPGRAPRLTPRLRQRQVSLCETLDRVLNKGAVIAGDIVISVADVELLYLGVNLVAASVETMREWAEDGHAPSRREAVSPVHAHTEA